MKPFAASLRWILLVVSMKGSRAASAALLGDDGANSTLNWNFHKVHGSMTSIPLNLRSADHVTLSIGACMAAAWLSFVPTAMFSARFMRKTWPKGWFQIHRGFMMVGLAVATLGLIFILCAHDGKFEVSPHSMCGICTISLAYVQPVIAFWRPHNEVNGHPHPRRWIFNWVHRTIGILTSLLAVVSVILGCKLLDVPGLPGTLAIPAMFIAFAITSFIVGEMINRLCCLDEYIIPSGNSDEESDPINDDKDYKQMCHWSVHLKSDVFWPTFFGVFAMTVSIMAVVLIGFIASTE